MIIHDNMEVSKNGGTPIAGWFIMDFPIIPILQIIITDNHHQ